MKLTLLLIPLIFLSSCTIDWNDEKDKKIAELEKQVMGLETINHDLSKEKQDLLIWSYFTPHAATRKIEFFMNWNFILHEDEKEVRKWIYQLSWSKLILNFENWEKTELKFYKWNDKDDNYYIEWTWEYFVKE
jgi:hypothetical protein